MSVQVVVVVLAAPAVAASPPYGPVGSAAAESASSVVTRPPPVSDPLARGVTLAGGVSAVLAESPCIQYETPQCRAPDTVAVGVIRVAVLVVSVALAYPATGSVACVPRYA